MPQQTIDLQVNPSEETIRLGSLAVHFLITAENSNGSVASFIPHAIYRTGQLQRLVVFYCGDYQESKVVVHQLITDSGFVGLDAGRLRMAKELEAPGRMNRAGLIEITQSSTQSAR